jgi:ribosomal protein S12 methylthiotransferase accessory factor
MAMEVVFPGGVRVDVKYKGHTIKTDQPIASGGTDEAPSPFQLFLASIAACAGFYAISFCQQRGIKTDGLSVALDTVYDDERKRVSEIRLDVALPKDFPQKYRHALLAAIDSCAVKKHIMEPPKFDVKLKD